MYDYYYDDDDEDEFWPDLLLRDESHSSAPVSVS